MIAHRQRTTQTISIIFVKLTEIFDTALTVDCVQPMEETYVADEDPLLSGTAAQQLQYPNASFEAAAEIGLFIKKSLFASVRKALAVLSTDAKINCQKQIPKAPDKLNICIGNDPCPKCMPAGGSGGCAEGGIVSQCGSSNVICPPIP